MATDLIARGLAAATRDGALPAMPSLAALAGRAVPAGMDRITVGGATYLADALATQALAAAHPRCCGPSADGRFWRLEPVGGTITFEQCGTTAAGNNQPAIQAAINYAAAIGIRRVLGTRPAYQMWDPLLTDPGGAFTIQWVKNAKPLLVPECDALEIDFGGATITLKGPDGSNNRIQDAPNWEAFATAIGYPAPGWVPGWMMVGGAIGHFTLRNVTVDGGFAGDIVNMDDVILSDKGFMAQDLAGLGTVEMDNVTLHHFGGEIMYDNCSSLHISRDCHFYYSGHSTWNYGSTNGRCIAYNLQSGQSRIVAETISGPGHTYIGGRFYEAGTGGASFIGSNRVEGPFNQANRQNDRSPPFTQFIGTRFEYFLNAVFIGSWTIGSIDCTDTEVWASCGFASAVTFQDVDLDITCRADRRSALTALTVAGPLTDDGSQPHNINARVHCTRTKLAETNNRYVANGVLMHNLIHALSCSFKVDGRVFSPFRATGTSLAGFMMPAVDTTGTIGDLPMSGELLYFSADQAYTITSRGVTLSPQADGTFNFTVDPVPRYTNGQRFRFTHDGSGGGNRVISFGKNAAGMRLAADRTLRRAGEFLELEWSGWGAIWAEAVYVGQGA